MFVPIGVHYTFKETIGMFIVISVLEKNPIDHVILTQDATGVLPFVRSKAHKNNVRYE